jgi:menaquinol-cytochrome c reductase cytochrome b/c subunit
MNRAIIGATVAAVAVSACGSNQTRTFLPGGPGASALKILIPTEVRGEERARVVAGRLVAADAGCLACHRIGTQGNSAPGSDLTHVGGKLSTAQLVHVLRSPPPPMPSFRKLHGLSDLVDFLHSLR